MAKKKPPKTKPAPYRGWAAGDPARRAQQAAAQAAAQAQAAVAAHEATKPAQAVAVNPFFTADDLAALNSFTTDFATKAAQIDYDLGNLGTDTTFQRTQVDQGAKQASASTEDDAAARGIFQSSIKDAAIYDIEASRALQQKFLDDKMTAASLNAGTQKQILSSSKENFDKAMAAKQVENAQGVNDAQSSAWATAMAAWESAKPAAPVAPPTSFAAPKPAAAKPKPKVATATAPLAKKPAAPKKPNQATAKVTPKAKKTIFGGYGG